MRKALVAGILSVVLVGGGYWIAHRTGSRILAPSSAEDVLAHGRRVYLQKCTSCHSGDGQGGPDGYPPLAGSEIVQGLAGFGESHLARIVLNGLAGPVTVRGRDYNGGMPSWKDDLDDDECAALLTYLRQAWGNHAPPISAEQIAVLRVEEERRTGPWTIAQLKATPPVLLRR